MRSLERFKDDIVIPEKIWTPRGNGHAFGTATWLTGESFNYNKLDAGSASIDQIAAKHLESQTPIASLELSMKGEGNFTKDITRNNISWINPTLPTSREFNPRALFDSMFRPKSSSQFSQYSR